MADNVSSSSRHRWSRAVLIVCMAVGLLVGGSAWLHSHRTPTWSEVQAYIALRHGDVDSVSTQALAQELLGPSPPVLLDVREPAEFAVSRLPRSRNAPPGHVLDFAERELAGLNRDVPIVVYCSVGVRSAAAVDDLRLLGFTRVRNLQGSIFRWANEGRSLEGGTLVHPFDAHWGRLLRADLHAPLSGVFDGS